MTWEEIKSKKSGTILHDEFDEGVRFIIMRGPGSLCAYLGIPYKHPLAGYDYDSLPLSCHGGLTFANESRGTFPSGYYWYGWDYSHCDDYSFYNDELDYPESLKKKWTLKDVKEDSWLTIYDFKQLMKLAEQIRNKK